MATVPDLPARRVARLLLPALLAACGGAGSGPAGLVPEPVPGPGDYARSLETGGLVRSYGLHVPAGWAPGGENPLVLAFHGLQSSPANLRAVSGLDGAADGHGVVVAYPAAARGDWNTECLDCGSDAVLERIGDVRFVADLVDRLDADVGIDRRRVYAIGISNGALFVHHLACAAGSLFAAVGSVAATLLAPAEVPPCVVERALPIAFFLGSEDTFFPPEGRLAGNDLVHVRLLSIEESVATWVERDRCAGIIAVTDLPDLADDGTTVRRHRYAACADGAEVVYYEIEGGGHTWPGSPISGGGGLGRVSRDISAAETAIQFFLDHAR